MEMNMELWDTIVKLSMTIIAIGKAGISITGSRSRPDKHTGQTSEIYIETKTVIKRRIWTT